MNENMPRRLQSGQTIVILAVGFVVLLAFVGLVTDISLLFVRYSTLRRAVDSAAVSAAGQIRRFQYTTAELNQAAADLALPITNQAVIDRANGVAFARNIAGLSLAARQFIEFYGLSPTAVLVDTCATLPGDPDLECAVTQKPRKLVRVTAQLDSPTVFLRLIGWNTVLLQASAISETAVLDIVMIFDSSESMANQTTYDDWASIGQGVRYFPPRMNDGPRNAASVMGDPFTPWTTALNLTQNNMATYTYAGQSVYKSLPFSVDASNNVTPLTDAAAGQPRSDCRVRFFPAAEWFRIPNGNPLPSNDVYQELQNYMNNVLGILGAYPTTWQGFKPAYDYFGCCNDPNGDWDFSDLICQPFKQVRDATQTFLNQVDFTRGDRVGYVVFDRGATLIDPDGAGPQQPLMTSQANAVAALKKVVGVRGENNFYADTNSDGYWDRYVIRGVAYDPANPGGSTQVDYNTTTPSFNNTQLGLLLDYPVKENCFFQSAALNWPRSLFSSPDFSLSMDTSPIPPFANLSYKDVRYPSPLSSGLPSYLNTVMHPNLNDSVNWPNSLNQGEKARYAYELWASCRGSNVGAALRVANNALTNPTTVRTNNAVWVMVMLGDGAAAGSDPVRRFGGTLTQPQVYNQYADSPVAGDYGVYGLCPSGNQYAPGPLVDQHPGQTSWTKDFPYCSDPYPETRHYCFDEFNRDSGGNIFVDLGANGSNCEQFYDVDDVARDWADYVAGVDNRHFGFDTTRQQNLNVVQRPVIFTIGFGLDFGEGDGSCNANLGDCLGEELLRYIADVGDNNHLDSDYMQDLIDDGAADLSLTGRTSPAEIWGGRGPCEGPIRNGFAKPDDLGVVNWVNLINPLPPTEDCGNYFNAPDGQRLKQVFDTIASRLFTRITQ